VKAIFEDAKNKAGKDVPTTSRFVSQCRSLKQHLSA